MCFPVCWDFGLWWGVQCDWVREGWGCVHGQWVGGSFHGGEGHYLGHQEEGEGQELDRREWGGQQKVGGAWPWWLSMVVLLCLVVGTVMAVSGCGIPTLVTFTGHKNAVTSLNWGRAAWGWWPGPGTPRSSCGMWWWSAGLPGWSGLSLRQGSWRHADDQENFNVNWCKVKISYISSMINHLNLSLQYYKLVNLN